MKTLAVTISSLVLWAGAASATANTGVCDAGTMKAAAKYCSASLGCWSKWVKAPEKDPGNVKLDACLAKSEDKAVVSALKAAVKAAKKGGTCSLDGPGAMLGTRSLADSIAGAAQFDWDPLAGDKADNGMRSGLLKTFGKLCGKSLATRAKFVAKPAPEKQEQALDKLLLGFVKTVVKILTQADKAGVDLDEEQLGLLFDMVERTSGLFAPPEPVSGAVAGVTAGSEHSCLWREDGSTSCWGRNDDGRAPASAGRFEWGVSAGGTHTCGVADGGRATCWGDNAHGKATPPKDDFWEVSAGTNASCGVRVDDDGISCWGSLAAPPTGEFLSVSVGSNFACATDFFGNIDCWGSSNSASQLDAPPGSGFHSLSSGLLRSCAINGSAMSCWGGGLAPLAGNHIEVSVGGFNSYCAVDQDGELACFSVTGPGLSPPPGEFFGVSAGGAHACALSDEPEPTAVCWGDNGSGQTDCSGIAGCGGSAGPPVCLAALQGERVYPPPDSVASPFLTITKVQGSPDYMMILDDELLALFEPLRGTVAEVAEFFDKLDAIGPTSCDGGGDRPLRVKITEQELQELIPAIAATDAQVSALLERADQLSADFEIWLAEKFFASFYKAVLGKLISSFFPIP